MRAFFGWALGEGEVHLVETAIAARIFLFVLFYLYGWVVIVISLPFHFLEYMVFELSK